MMVGTTEFGTARLGFHDQADESAAACPASRSPARPARSIAKDPASVVLVVRRLRAGGAAGGGGGGAARQRRRLARQGAPGRARGARRLLRGRAADQSAHGFAVTSAPHVALAVTSARGMPRIRDIVAPELRALFVGINPGLRSAALGHNFAGKGNPFWRLLYAAGLIDRPLDVRRRAGAARLWPGHHQRVRAAVAERRRADAARSWRRARARSSGGCAAGSLRAVVLRRAHHLPADLRARGDTRRGRKAADASAARPCSSCPTRAASTPAFPAFGTKLDVVRGAARLARRSLGAR